MVLGGLVVGQAKGSPGFHRGILTTSGYLSPKMKKVSETLKGGESGPRLP